MILNISQKKAFKDLEFEIENKGSRVAIARSPFESGKFNILVDYSIDGVVERLYLNPSDTTYGNSIKDRLTFRIFTGATKVGDIVGSTKKTGLLSGYEYIDSNYKGSKYRAYIVGFGYKGLYLCIYKVCENKEVMVATVKKDIVVHNHGDNYTLYMKNEEDYHVPILLTLYWDSVDFNDRMDICVHSTKTTIKNSINKEEISKFNPDFISDIIIQEC